MAKLIQKASASGGEFILYQTEDGRTRLEVRFEAETAWLTQAQMAALFQTSIPNVSMHIRNLFAEEELCADSVVKESLITAADGKKYSTKFFNLDVIISVGYRVKSLRGTQFRIWATQRLKEYIVKGFTMDDDRLKRRGGGNYFEELLARIRDIRSSEKVFWRKVLDIYATSIDYDPSVEASRAFFATVQNKMHWAAHGHTAAEVVHARADAAKQNMGMTNWVGSKPTRDEAVIAKNYLGKMGMMACLVVGLGVAVSRAANPDDGKSLERGNERPQEIPLWPEGRMTSLSEPEKVIEKSKDPVKQDRRIFNVSIPTIVVYRPASTSTNAPVPAVVICPGGAYGGLAFDIEGSDVARWLNSLGIAGVVLKYRVPMAKDDGKHRLPLQDAQRALSLVRSRAAEWNLDPQRIGVMGFSAGGHLAVNACNNHEGRAYDPSDAVDQASCRPDFAVLVYPAYLAPKSPGPDLYPEIKVTSNTPPTFLVHAEDDPISVENSLFYYLALKKANVPAQMVLYAKGGHGYGLGVRGGPVAGWPNACRLWMEDQGIVAGEGERAAGCQVQQNYFSVRSPDAPIR